jgi:hypothetical protein
MDEFLKNYEKTIKKTHSVSFLTPKYKEEFTTNVNEKLFMAIAEKAIERLEWHLIYKDDNNIEAKRTEKNWGMERYTEGITASYEYGNVTVKSETLGNEIWDLGRNSKRVKLFIFAFEDTLKTLDKTSLKELEKEIEKKNNWDDYVIPDTLPQPTETKTPNFMIPIIGGLIASLTLGFLLALISVKGIYIVFLFEFLVAAVIVFVMKYLIKISNFTDFNKLMYLLATMIVLLYASNQYFQYEIILNEGNFGRIGFGKFMNLRFSKGLIVKKMNTGWIGLVISWLIQLGLTGLFVYLKILLVLAKYVIGRVPSEVVDFAYYHFVNGKSEEIVRKELTKKGWSDIRNQDEVFEAIGGIQNTIQFNRI